MSQPASSKGYGFRLYQASPSVAGTGDSLHFLERLRSPGYKAKMTGYAEAPFRAGGLWQDWRIGLQDLPSDVTIELQKALECFDKHQLDEAEALFERILCALEASPFPGSERAMVEALGGLAELYFKRSRACHRDEMAWHRVMLQSAALQNELVRYCRELDDRCDQIDEAERRKWYWVEEALKKSERLLVIIDSLLIESLQSRVATASKRRPTDEIAHAPVFVDTGWLDRLQAYLRRGVDRQPIKEPLSPKSPVAAGHLDAASVHSESTAESTDPEGGQQPRRQEKKIDCDRVQRTIMKLVRQISSDIRQRFIRKKLPEDMFRRTVSSEMIAKCSPMPETKDVLALFENAIIQYNYGVSRDEFRQWNVEPCDADSEETGNETGSTDTQSDDNGPANLPYMPMLCQEEPSPASDDGGRAFEDDSYNLAGVLTVWRAYGKRHDAHVRPRPLPSRPYVLQGFEELSALTETPLLSADQRPSHVSTPSVSSSVEASRPATASSSVASSPGGAAVAAGERTGYVTEDKVQHALALALVKCAQHLQKDPHGLNQACELYKYALAILRAGNTEVKGRQELVAHIFRNVGIIRCAQGDISTGSQLMHESMELFSADDDVENINVAEVWYELGDAFMQQQWKEDTIFEHVMKLVRDELTRDVRPQDDKDVADDASIDSESSDGGASYCVCAHEALGCYRSALTILSRLRRKKETHTGLYVDVLTKLGDCAIVVGEYERAVLCYEEALYLCQNTLGSVSLTNSAHVLSMLGTTNFLLGTYSKAATMYETANILQQHLYGLEDNFEMAFTLSMLGITYYVMRHFHKCIAWCMKAFELYVNIYKQEIIFVDSLHRWFITQTLYCLGFAYSTLNFHDKALHNLDLAKNLIGKAHDDDVDVRQHVKILKVMADVYANLDQNEMALDYYQEALDQSLRLGDERSATTLQNQLLNRMAGIHVNTRQYGTAAEYLEQALDCQRSVENSIKGDLMGILYQLGITYTLSGDIDRAIECFNEFHEAYQEAQGSPGLELAKALCSLGTLYHLKGCMQDDNDDMMEYLASADQYYKDAVAIDTSSPICAYYANFLHQQEQFADALDVMLRFVFLPGALDEFELRYNGPEQAVLPEHLLHDLNDTEEVILDVWVFAKFLGVLCLKQLLLIDEAEDCLESMVTLVGRSDVSLNHSMLGYALLEMGLYGEAARSFDAAASLQHDNDVSLTNRWISLLLDAYAVLSRAFYHVWEVTTEAYVDLVGPAPTPTPTVGVLPDVVSQIEAKALRDSGYYDHTEEAVAEPSQVHLTADDQDAGYTSTSHDDGGMRSPDAAVAAAEDVFCDETYEEWHTEEEVQETPPHVLEAILKSQMEHAARQNTASVGLLTGSYVNYVESPVADREEEQEEEEEEEWIIEEEVTLETPAAIISALSGKLVNPDPEPHSGYASLLHDSGEELTHKSVSRNAGDEELESSWTRKQRTIMPPDVLEGLNKNYEYPGGYRTTEARDAKPFRTATGHDANGNGTYSSAAIRSTIQTRDTISGSWTSHYDGLNANTRETSGPYTELNANQDDEEEVWQTFEETVETPPAILAVMLANQNKV